MSMQQAGVGRSVVNGSAVVLALSLFGLFALPVVFGGLPERTPALIWLGLAIAVCACLLLPARPLASSLAAQVRRLPGMRPEAETWTGRTGVDIARLLVAAGYVVLFQAILRRPLVAVFGAEAEPFVVEAAFGTAALLILLALLAWLYGALKPLLEGVALAALDALFATSNSKSAPEPSGSVRPDLAVTAAAPRADTTIPASDAAPAATVTSPRLRTNYATTEAGQTTPQDSAADTTQVRR
jgi:hypothetical protein